jgi:hypothetical protein
LIQFAREDAGVLVRKSEDASPLRVRRVDTVIDDRCPFACLLCVGRDREVGTDHLNARWGIGSFASNSGTRSSLATR